MTAEAKDPSLRAEDPIPVPASTLPAPLVALEEERSSIIRVLRRLGELRAPGDVPERADLAHELVRAASRYRDVMSRVVVPALQTHDAPSLDRMDADDDALCMAMEEVHRRTSHIDPRNAHAGDPQGLEDAIAVVVEGVAEQLLREDAVLQELVEGLDDSARTELASEVARAVPHASEHPRPPRGRVARALRNAEVKLDNLIEDVATPTHPGAPVVRPPSDRTS